MQRSKQDLESYIKSLSSNFEKVFDRKLDPKILRIALEGELYIRERKYLSSQFKTAPEEELRVLLGLIGTIEDSELNNQNKKKIA